MTAPTLPMSLPEQRNPNPPEPVSAEPRCKWCRTTLPTAAPPLSLTELAWSGCISCLSALDQ